MFKCSNTLCPVICQKSSCPHASGALVLSSTSCAHTRCVPSWLHRKSPAPRATAEMHSSMHEGSVGFIACAPYRAPSPGHTSTAATLASRVSTSTRLAIAPAAAGGRRPAPVLGRRVPHRKLQGTDKKTSAEEMPPSPLALKPRSCPHTLTRVPLQLPCPGQPAYPYM